MYLVSYAVDQEEILRPIILHGLIHRGQIAGAG